MHERENALNDWLSKILKNSDFTLKPLAGDASFRKYWRVQQHEKIFILMDAPPPKEDIRPFIAIDEALRQTQIHAPQIYAANESLGTLLLEDFGDLQMLKALEEKTANALYQEAMRVLGQMQDCQPHHFDLPKFDIPHMMAEMQLFIDWYWTQHLGLSLSTEQYQIILSSFSWIAHEIAQLPQVFIHRDYHSRNLMCIENNTLGVLDFQDAMIGPVGYDLVSLLRDCYIEWPEKQVRQWTQDFYEYHGPKTLSLEAFIRAVDLCGIQRHLKVLGIFCRLHLRDGKAAYLNDLPLTLQYLQTNLKKYPQLLALNTLLEEAFVCL